MTFSKQLFPLFFLLLLFFPLLHASNPKKCSSSSKKPIRCGPSEVPIRFPFCDHPGFNLHCTDLDKIVLELPLSGTFLVRDIDYINQLIYVSDPKNCLVKRLLTFNISGSPFSSRFGTDYMFFSCPKEVVLPSWFRFISCLSNSTSSFYVVNTIFQDPFMPRSCQMVKRLFGPDNLWVQSIGISSYFSNQSLWLKWHSPNCSSCEMENLRCGLKNTTSLEVKCFGYKSVLSNKTIVTLSVSIPIGIIFVSVCIGFIRSNIFDIESSDSNPIVAHQPREIMATTTRGLDQPTIESYKKMELGESRRLPGINGTVCSICLSEYASKETVRCIPKCEHCFHIECIDVWLKIHGSCPLCRNLPTPSCEAI